MKIKPLYDRILVKRLEEQEKTAGGLYIPDTEVDDLLAGPDRGLAFLAPDPETADALARVEETADAAEAPSSSRGRRHR